MHVYPLRCCLDRLYVVGAVNNGARLGKLPILVRNRIEAVFRHCALPRCLPVLNIKSELRFRFETGPASIISIISNAWQTCHTRRAFGNLISKAATAAAEPNIKAPLDRQTALRSGHLPGTCWLQSPGSRLCLRSRTELVLATACRQ